MCSSKACRVSRQFSRTGQLFLRIVGKATCEIFMIEQGAGEEEGEEDNKIKEKRADEDRGSRKYSKIDRNST